MTLSELWRHFRLLQSPESISEKDRTFLERFLQEEYKTREKRRIEYLMKMSGIQRIKLLADFDWTFNPKIPRDKIMEFLQTDFLKRPSKLAKAKSVFSFIEYYGKVPLLCLDELGYVFPTKEQADCIFQIISKRSEVRTTVITTNLIPSQWGKIFDSTTASAILDRLSLNGRFIIFEGRSYRSKK
jgi:DNA replication protein DnaC